MRRAGSSKQRASSFFPARMATSASVTGFRARFSMVSLGYCLERASMACEARAASPQLAKAAEAGERFAPVGDCWREAEARDFAEEQSPIRLEVKAEAPPRIAANSVLPNFCAEACASRMVSEEACCLPRLNSMKALLKRMKYSSGRPFIEATWRSTSAVSPLR